MLLITIFVELREVAGRSRTWAGNPKAVPCRGLEKNGVVRAWHGRGMASRNQTRPHCVYQMGKKHSKHLAARRGRGTAWARHAMCESDFTGRCVGYWEDSLMMATMVCRKILQICPRLIYIFWRTNRDKSIICDKVPCCSASAASRISRIQTDELVINVRFCCATLVSGLKATVEHYNWTTCTQDAAFQTVCSLDGAVPTFILTPFILHPRHHA
jgi:hypothetical protein